MLLRQQLRCYDNPPSCARLERTVRVWARVPIRAPAILCFEP